MRIFLIGNYARDEQTSMLLYASMLEKALREKGISVELWKPEECLSGGKWTGYFDKFVYSKRKLAEKLKSFRREAGEEPYVVHICDHSNAVYYNLIQKHPHSISCHDLMAIQSAKGMHRETSTRLSGKVLQSWILRSLKKFSHVACMSENTEKDLNKFCEPDYTQVIYSALNADFNCSLSMEELREKYGFKKDSKVIFNLSSNSWYKNREGVLRIFASLADMYPATELQFVMAGAPMTEDLLCLFRELKLDKRLQMIEFPAKEELAELYHLSDVFLFPSRYEGFGWPSLEAQSCFCPVVAGTGGSQKEVLQESAFLADAANEEQFVQYCKSLLDDPALRKLSVERGKTNLLRFDSETMANSYLAFFNRVYEDFAQHSQDRS